MVTTVGSMKDKNKESELADYDIEQVIYHHIVVEGSSYEVGQQLAEYVKQDVGRKEFFTSAKLEPNKIGFKDFQLLQDYYEEHCPGIKDEIQGLADGLETTPDKIPLWSQSVKPASAGKNCSQLLVLSSATDDNHSYLGRSYEWIHTEEDLVLCTTRVKGRAEHIGFTSLLSGRSEGMNEHGFVVSMTGAGTPNVPLKHKGIVFWIAIRTLLDWCQSVEEALERLESLPLSDYFNLILVDKKDHAALVEFADGEMGVEEIIAENQNPFLFSTNHFKLPETEQYNKLNVILGHSQHRSSLIQSMLQEKTPRVTKGDILDLLSTHHPDGLCNHYYNDYFGTTWSMIFDKTDRSVDVCFSAPTHNDYKTFRLDDPVGIYQYPSVVPITKKRLPL